MFLSFPVVMNYFSPVLIAMGAAAGIVNGSFLVFGFLFVAALFLGRGFCGWVCPVGGLQEACFMVRDSPVNGRKTNWIKYVVWVPWIGLIIFLAVRGGGFTKISPLFMVETGISVSEPSAYIIFFLILLIFVVQAFSVGRRAFCHTLCWIAPFMIIGRKLRNLAAWPSLRLKTQEEKCVDCKRCTKNCPMSLDVNGLVHARTMENTECMLCGTCVDVCPNNVISFSFSTGK